MHICCAVQCTHAVVVSSTARDSPNALRGPAVPLWVGLTPMKSTARTCFRGGSSGSRAASRHNGRRNVCGDDERPENLQSKPSAQHMARCAALRCGCTQSSSAQSLAHCTEPTGSRPLTNQSAGHPFVCQRRLCGCGCGM
jgi:hypothetical protein